MKIIAYLGGLGNQMFQHAFIESARKTGENIFTTTFSYLIKSQHNGFELSKIFGIKLYKNLLMPPIFRIIRQNDSTYCPEILNQKKSTLFLGYWQNEKYFKPIEHHIRKIFMFPEFTEAENLRINELIHKSNSVSIHIRRGDYCGNPLYDNCVTEKYYQNAIAFIKSKLHSPHWFIFSDDIDWCKKNLDIEGDCYFIDWNKKKNSFRDMQLMSLCKHNIITNSSFSWWGAWLNNNLEKIIIAPKTWLNNCDELNYNDICPSSWIRL